MHASRIALAALVLSTAAAAQQPVNYRMRYVAHWSSATHPGAYPSGAHFSPLIGGTHSSSVRFWQPGGLATNGIEVMAETGNPTPLRNEVLAAIGAGTAGEVVEASGLNSPGVVVGEFEATDTFHLVTVVTMVAPTPDWFVGTESLDLKPGGLWANSLSVDLYTWDSGTDSGPDFTSPNQDTNPQQPIALQTTGPFFGTVPLATLTFERVQAPEETCNGDGGDQLGCTACPCANEAPVGTIGGCLNGAGSSAILRGLGIASVSSDSLRFELAGGPAGALCVLTAGDALAPTNAANPCFGLGSGTQSTSFDGLRCAVGNTRRHGGRATDGAGRVGVTNAGWGPPDAPAVGLIAQGGYVAGQTRFFQVVYRDDPALACMRGLNTTQAIVATFAP